MKWSAKARSYLWITLACAVYALGFDWCYAPNDMAFGGLTGLAQVVHQLLPRVPVGGAVIVMNIPLFLVGWRLLGGGLLVSSLFAMGVSSVLLDVFSALYAFQPMDPMLACLFGGVLVGASLGVILLQGATTGGTDTIARLLKLSFPWRSMGRLLMLVDMAVILAVAVTFRSLTSALYGTVRLYVATVVMDAVIYGVDRAAVAYIISERHREIAAAVMGEIDRGVTLLKGEGGWSGREKNVLMVAVRQRQMAALKRIVEEQDESAFFIVCQAHEVLGDGFGKNGSQRL